MATPTKTTAKRPAPRGGKAQANKTALREAIAAMNGGSAERYLQLFRPDARLHDFPPGIDAVEDLSLFHSATAELYPDASVTLDEVVAERDRVVTRYTWRATNGPGVALVAKGGAITRFSDGRIAECWNLPAELETVAAKPDAAV